MFKSLYISSLVNLYNSTLTYA
ncbi:hypothetical protein CGLO_04797 [Colletotrichum gloeosporioides Cg-14]|uniref:Uncharacterized protein n=1 Tax=Colletotrichum gloeosporioides (strain Cg-14) TaxID=1237896 RepID=T0LU47_COLGC|nr:hypothetical protein CGLO_04797 [Colletotrichum gloeosporioides Cg-14]